MQSQITSQSQDAIQEANSPNSSLLVRHLGTRNLFYLGVANMIGTGVFMTSGFILRDVGNVWVMLTAWLIGGFLSLCGALCYAELGAMFPQAGGDYVFLKESFGSRIAFLSGWISLWVGFSAAIAASSMAFAQYSLSVFMTTAHSASLTKMVALVTLIGLTVIHVRGLKSGNNVLSFLTLGKICFIFLFIGLGFAIGNGSFQNLNMPYETQSLFSPEFATALIFVSFAYSGWNVSTYVGAEAKNPQHTLPTAIILSTIFVIACYLLLNLVFVYSSPLDKLSGVEEIGHVAAQGLFGQQLGPIFSLVIAFFVLSAISSMLMVGPRVYYAMAKDKLFFHIFGNVDQKSHIPRRAILLQLSIACLLIFTSTFEAIVLYTGFMLSVFSSLTVLGMMVLRHRQPQRERPYRTWGYPITPLVFILLNVWIIVFSIRSQPIALVYGLITVALGWLAFEYFNRIR